MVAVDYERIRGLRARGRERDDSDQARKSRTFSVMVRTLFDARDDRPARKKWIGGDALRVRSPTKPKSMRLKWLGGGVAVGFMGSGARKGSVTVEQLKLPTKQAATQVNQAWAERLDALAGVLAMK